MCEYEQESHSHTGLILVSTNPLKYAQIWPDIC